MIVFNTIKKAEHYVNYYNKINKQVRNNNWEQGYLYSYLYLDIDYDSKRVILNSGADQCGCGCDTYTFNSRDVIGRIK
jgi:hypothetical protein